MIDNNKDDDLVINVEGDFRLELDEFMESLKKDFDENIDPDGRYYKFARMYLDAAGIDENDIDGVHYLLDRSLTLEEQYLEELEHLDKNNVERINYLNDKIEKCKAIDTGLLSIVLNYTEDSDFLA